MVSALILAGPTAQDFEPAAETHAHRVPPAQARAGCFCEVIWARVQAHPTVGRLSFLIS